MVASLRGEDTAWLDRVENVRGWERVVYVVDGRRGKGNGGEGGEGGGFRVPRNKGREGMVYLSFIIDNYNNLPNVTVFLHSLRYQWHNDDPMYDGIPILQNLRVSHIHEEGYANLRCCWTLGCPAQIHPNKEHEVGDKESETQYRAAFMELFPNLPVPDVVGVACCAQFAVTKSRILARPLADYMRYRDWLLTTDLADDTSGRILEYSWHMIFGKAAVHCPPAPECYCRTFGYCNLTCTERTCEGRYTLPPYSTMPEGWPEKGWE